MAVTKAKCCDKADRYDGGSGREFRYGGHKVLLAKMSSEHDLRGRRSQLSEHLEKELLRHTSSPQDGGWGRLLVFVGHRVGTERRIPKA